MNVSNLYETRETTQIDLLLMFSHKSIELNVSFSELFNAPFLSILAHGLLDLYTEFEFSQIFLGP